MESKTTGLLSTAKLTDRDHLAISYANQSQLATEVSDFVKRGIGRNQINIVFVTAGEAERYLAFFRESGTDVDKLLASGDFDRANRRLA